MRRLRVVILILVVAGIAFNFDYPKNDKVLIYGAVVPHHDLVKSARQSFFQELGFLSAQPNTIILVSPNHFNAGTADIQTTDRIWELANGVIEPDLATIASVAAAGARLEDASFTIEHGIKNLLEDIALTFPGAKIVPIILKRGVMLQELVALERELGRACKRCIMIASVDFSHYQPALLANLHDKVSLRALQNLDTNLLMTKAEVDSPEALTLLALWVKAHDSRHFTKFAHTNSGFLLGDEDGETTTHITGWYEAGEQAEASPSLTFTVGGDVMFARGVAKRFEKNLDDSFSNLGDRFFWGTDASIVNLEGAISPTPVQPNTRYNNLIFIFPPEAAETLKSVGINLVSLSNNHSDNGGSEMLNSTKKMLVKQQIQCFGEPHSVPLTSIGKVEGEKIKLAVIGINALYKFRDISAQIETLKFSGYKVAVFPHWGREYETQHNAQQEALAHAWIDAGADLVVGSHPHVIQDVGVYRGRPIVYSLGNLLFDQNFSEETQQGIVLSGELTNKGLSLFALPTQAVKYKPTLMKGEAKQQVLSDLYQPWSKFKVSEPVGTSFYFPNN